MYRKPIVPTPYYIKYETYKTSDSEYKIVATYFIHTGNALNNIDAKKTRNIIVSAEKLKRQQEILDKRISKTYKLLGVELRRIGANEIAARSIIDSKMK